MKQIFHSILSFEVFFKIFKHIDSYINSEGYANSGLNMTDVHYCFGHTDGGSPKNVRYGYFKMRATPDQIALIKKETPVVEPFGGPTSTKDTEYNVVVLSVTGWFTQKYGILFQRRGHMNAPVGSPERMMLDVAQMTTVVLLLPMNISPSSTGNKILQTQYFFENLHYTKEGEIYFPYNKWEKEIGDIRN